MQGGAQYIIMADTLWNLRPCKGNRTRHVLRRLQATADTPTGRQTLPRLTILLLGTAGTTNARVMWHKRTTCGMICHLLMQNSAAPAPLKQHAQCDHSTLANWHCQRHHTSAQAANCCWRVCAASVIPSNPTHGSSTPPLQLLCRGQTGPCCCKQPPRAMQAQRTKYACAAHQRLNRPLKSCSFAAQFTSRQGATSCSIPQPHAIANATRYATQTQLTMQHTQPTARSAAPHAAAAAHQHAAHTGSCAVSCMPAGHSPNTAQASCCTPCTVQLACAPSTNQQPPMFRHTPAVPPCALHNCTNSATAAPTASPSASEKSTGASSAAPTSNTSQRLPAADASCCSKFDSSTAVRRGLLGSR